MAFDFRFINTEQLRSDPRFGGWYSRAAGQPSWAWKLAGTVALLVFVVPIVLLVCAALLAFAVVFGLAMLVHWFVGLFGGGSGADKPRGDEGRRNVRVIRGDEV